MIVLNDNVEQGRNGVPFIKKIISMGPYKLCKAIYRKTVKKGITFLTDNRVTKPLKRAIKKRRDAIHKKQLLEKCKKEYAEAGLDNVPDTFTLYRILGNDLDGRHSVGQTRRNLQFILEHEPNFDNCEKRWVINRIVNKDEEDAVITLLEQYKQEYVRIPFLADEYAKVDFDFNCFSKKSCFISNDYFEQFPASRTRAVMAAYRLKNNYVMNNNGARNTALQDGKTRSKWILPWDGNCFLTKDAWGEIYNAVTSAPFYKYHIVPMARVIGSNNDLLQEGYNPPAAEEPQIVFRSDSIEMFNDGFCYGRRPKVEMFWRLMVPGKWDNWKDEPWDQKRLPVSAEAGQFQFAGWVARLFSGSAEQELRDEKSFQDRGRAREKAIITTLSSLDAKLTCHHANSSVLTCLNVNVLEKECINYQNKSDKALVAVIDSLIKDADEALARGPYSVIDKTELPPSGIKNDYYHPAPYFWPDPNDENAPYVFIDGKRVPGTELYEDGSDKYDRTRLQRVFDDSFMLALAWKFTGNTKYADYGVKILKRFFINPETAMNPHLNYSQVRRGHNNNIGSNSGIIEMKDLYFYLDAVRLFELSGILAQEDIVLFKQWLSKYLSWLLDSPQGKQECCAANNHGMYYDLQVAAIASFLDEQVILIETLLRAMTRIEIHFSADGSQPEELKRTMTEHYCYFNFQGWLYLAEIASRWGINFWKYKSSKGINVQIGAEWLISQANIDWQYQQIKEFDKERFLPFWFALPENIRKNGHHPFPYHDKYEVKPKFYPHDGIRPYWNIGLGN
jgi:hypothetical protein